MSRSTRRRPRSAALILPLIAAVARADQEATSTRVHPTADFIPRNAPPLFNLHLLRHLFWDGRVAQDGAGTLQMPPGVVVGPEMTAVFEFGALSAIGLMPVTSREVMRSTMGDNELAGTAPRRKRRRRILAARPARGVSAARRRTETGMIRRTCVSHRRGLDKSTTAF